LENYFIVPKDYWIMIVDDEKMVRTITEESLKEIGYNVVGFCNPEEAINYYRKNHSLIDFVILDMMMPKINGAETFHHLQNINPFVLACVLSGYDGVEGHYNYLLSDGLQGFLKKPIHIDDLNNEIEDILSKHYTFDIYAGLSTLLNNKRIYKKLVNTYHEENKDLNQRIINHLENKEFSEIELLIHKIKGISLNLGAKRLYNLASKLNRHLKEQEYELVEIMSFVKYHNLVIKDIERFLKFNV